MEKLKAFIKKYYEGLAYLFFGGLATLLNLVLFAVFQAVLGTGFATGIGNVLDNIICILFAYWTNRTFVFRSKNSGQAALAEFGQFVACRIGTMIMDQFIIWLGVIKNVLVKGGHLTGDAVDYLCTPEGVHKLACKRVDSPNTHGTGCTLSSAITANLAHGMDMLSAVTKAKNYITEAIEKSFTVGKGHSPVNHFYDYYDLKGTVL